VRDGPSELRLPPLNALRAFEAAGRLESIRGAAGELVVTPGAVSRHIRVLEDWLGVTLFRRSAHSVSLTQAGQAYLAAVGPHLRAIAAATERIAAAPELQLRVRTWTSFAGWLVPRLPEFRRLNPGIEVQLIASSQGTEFHHPDVDVEIIGYGTWDEAIERYPETDFERLPDPAHEAVAVVHTHIVCVCSPAYLAGHVIAAPADLLRASDHCLLQSLSTPDLWDRWLRAAGASGGSGAGSRRELVYGDAALTAQAARAGQGIAILPETVVRDDIDEGRLVVLFGPEVVNCSFDYYLLAPPDRLRRRPVQLLRDWLSAQPA
jgi:LysR family transcriptional regulator, glycine cleavage system transcriptional activator